jgi:hypothetical protein
VTAAGVAAASKSTAYPKEATMSKTADPYSPRIGDVVQGGTRNGKPSDDPGRRATVTALTRASVTITYSDGSTKALRRTSFLGLIDLRGYRVLRGRAVVSS